MAMKKMSDSTNRKGRKKTLPNVAGFKPGRYDVLTPSGDPMTVQRTKKGDAVVGKRPKKRPVGYKRKLKSDS